MICDNCKRMICMQAFTNTKCEICETKIITGHMPGYKVCKKCAEKNNLCEQCGKKVKE